MTIKSLNFAKVLPIIIVLGLYLGLSFSANAQSDSDWCYARSVPYIDVIPSTEEIFFNFTKSEEELNNFKIDTVNPYGNDKIVDVGGLMEGGINVQHNLSLGYVTNPNINMTCLWFDKLTVNIGIKPTIYIAREYNKGTCMHNAIMEHEMKHIEVDKKIVNEYANKVGYEINDYLTRNTIFGPVPASELVKAQTQMTAEITAILQEHVEEMKESRRKAQQNIDSREEYDYVSAQCRSFKKKKR